MDLELVTLVTQGFLFILFVSICLELEHEMKANTGKETLVDFFNVFKIFRVSDSQ